MEDFEFVETTDVKEGVRCHVYEYKHDDSRDLGIVEVEKGYKTPKQKVLLGDKTIEIFSLARVYLRLLEVMEKQKRTLILVVKVELS